MNVQMLIEFLKPLNPDANVYLMERPEWPTESEVFGVTQRNFYNNSMDGDMCDEEPRAYGEPCSEDVFIVAGSQLRDGSQGAWDAC